jgi:methyl-accepting chemotaxis protein
MTLLRALLRPFVRSLALRWVFYVTVAAGIGIATLLVVTSNEMEHQLAEEGATVMALARQKTAERMEAEIALIEYRIAALVQGLDDSLGSVSRLRTTQSAVRSLNDVVITEEVGKKITAAGFTGALILDTKLDVIGSHQSGAELVAANEALRNHDLSATFRASLDRSSPDNPRGYRYVGMFDAAISAILLAPLQDDYGAVIAKPVFDDFGEPIAMIVGYRSFERSESRLTEFAGVTKSIVALMLGSRVISIAGSGIDTLQFTPAEEDGLLGAPDLGGIARCRETFPALSICVIHRFGEIERFRSEILSIGRQQFERTRHTLISIGGLSLAIILFLLIGLGRHLTRPLSEITRAVDRVAAGEWRVEVRHTGREDEIGRIARAVASMQLSLGERDRMRQEMVRIDAINQRRLLLDTAVARFEDGMAVVMKDISDTVRALSETNAVIDAAARQADTQVEKIRNASMATATRATVVSRTTLEMSHTIREIARRVRNTSSVVLQSETRARAVEEKLGEFTSVAQGAEDAIGVLQGLTADLAQIGLRASLDAAAAGEAGGEFSPFAASIDALAARAVEATDLITQALGRLGDVADGAYGAIGEVTSELGEALRETEEISVAIEEQDAATKEIADGLTNSANALLSLADAVDQLRQNMTHAQTASADFVQTARRIADDAKTIDDGIRSFVREVVA